MRTRTTLYLSRMWKIFRTRSYLIHEYLVLIDKDSSFQKEGIHTADDIVATASLLLKTSSTVAQETYDEILILDLAEHKTINEKDCLLLTKPGLKRLQNRYYKKEHGKTIESKLTTYTVILANVVLATISLIVAAGNNNKELVNKAQEISDPLNSINTAIIEGKFYLIHDTVYIRDSSDPKNHTTYYQDCEKRGK